MSNTTDDINNNKQFLEIAFNLIDGKIADNVRYIGYCNQKPLVDLKDIPEWSTDSEKLVEIFNLAKTKETLKMNHTSYANELKTIEKKKSKKK